jgi:hypothetical protein
VDYSTLVAFLSYFATYLTSRSDVMVTKTIGKNQKILFFSVNSKIKPNK